MLTGALVSDSVEPVANATFAQIAEAEAKQLGSTEGVRRVVAAPRGSVIRIPSWYGATSRRPARISILDSISGPRRNSSARDADVQVTAVSGDGAVEPVQSLVSEVLGLYTVQIRTRPVAGPDVFRTRTADAPAN
jgi:hypothetical protein